MKVLIFALLLAISYAQTVPKLSDEMANMLEHPEIGHAYQAYFKGVQDIFKHHGIDWKIPTRDEPGGIMLPKNDHDSAELAVGDLWSDVQGFFNTAVTAVKEFLKLFIYTIINTFTALMNDIGYDRLNGIIIPVAGAAVVKDPTSFIETRIVYKPKNKDTSVEEFCSGVPAMATKMNTELQAAIDADKAKWDGKVVAATSAMATGIGAAFGWAITTFADIACDFAESTTGESAAVIEKYWIWMPCISKPVKMRWDLKANPSTGKITHLTSLESSISHHGLDQMGVSPALDAPTTKGIHTASVRRDEKAVATHLGSSDNFHSFLVVSNILLMGTVVYLLNRTGKQEMQTPLL